MTTRTITLTVPTDFTLPSVLRNTTPEMNAMILMTAPAIYKTLSELNYTQKIDELTDKLNAAKHENQARNSAVFQMEERITNAISEKLSEIDTDILRTVNKLEVISDPKLTRNVEKLAENVGKISLNTDYMEEFMERMEKTLTALTPVVSSTRKTSQAIGAENEMIMDKIINDTFATHGAGFDLMDKKHFSGDHIFRWNGLVIMVEDKKYSKTVQKKETEKAIRDFNFHPECDVLLMISMDTAIRGHETADGIDTMIYDNRLVIFVSNFAEKGDLRMYIRRVIQPIMIAGKTLLAKLRDDPEKISEKFQYAFQVIPMIMNTINDQETTLVRYITETTKTINTVHRTLNTQRDHLNKLLEVLNGDDQVIHGSESALVNDDDQDYVHRSDDDDGGQEIVPQRTTSVVKQTGRTCRTCGGVGHDSRNCKSSPAARSSDDVAVAPKIGSRKCGKCGQYGHNRATCTKA